MLTPKEALERLRAMVGQDFPYTLGTERDCAGVVVKAYDLRRHRPGFAHGALPAAWSHFADVVDDINTNSMIKDALVARELFRFVPDSQPLEPGDLLAYPTIIIVDADRTVHKFIGHVQMVEDPKGAVAGGPYCDAWILHSHGPNGRSPAVTRNKAYVMDQHNHAWPKLEHKAWALRATTALAPAAAPLRA